jgi:phage terminase small subunit
VKLSEKHKRFVAEYLIDLNATQAAIRAGYKAKWAEKNAIRLKGNEGVAEAIAEGQKKRLNKLEITAEKVLGRIERNADANMYDYIRILESGEAVVDLSALTREQAYSIQEITVDETAGGSGDGVRERVKRTRFRLKDTLGANELLGRYLKLWTDKVQLSVDDSLAGILAFKRRLGDTD